MGVDDYMTYEEAKKYYDGLPENKRARFNVLVGIGAKLGKPAEGAYSYAHTIMEEATKKTDNARNIKQ